MALRHTPIHRKPVLAPVRLCSGLLHAGPWKTWEQINLTNNSPAAARPAELMAEEVAK